MTKPMGRPPKPEARYVFKTVRFPPELWAQLEEIAPPGRRSAIIHEGLRRELARLKRRSAASGGKTGKLPTTEAVGFALAESRNLSRGSTAEQ